MEIKHALLLILTSSVAGRPSQTTGLQPGAKDSICHAKTVPIMGKREAMFRYECPLGDPAQDEDECAGSMHQINAPDVSSGEVWDRFNLKFDAFVKAGNSDGAIGSKFARSTTDGKNALHLAINTPPLVASDLRSIVQWTDGWPRDQNITRDRFQVVAKVEEKMMPSILKLLDNYPKMATQADSGGFTPLHAAANGATVETCKLLLKRGADANAQDESGQTPLHLAAVVGSPEIALLLIANGADRNLRDKYGASFDDYLKSPGIGIFPEDAETLFGIKPEDFKAPIKDPKPVDDTEGACPLDGGWKTGKPDVDDEDLRCDVDQRSPDLSPEEWFSDYYLRGRPVLLRGALPLAERCVLDKASALKSKTVLNMENKCGATAYPSITSQSFCPTKCGLAFLEDARFCNVPKTHAKPAYKYRPTVVRSHMGKAGQSAWSKIVPDRFADGTAPFKQLCTAFIKSGNKQLFMSGKDAGATMHFHAAAYNALFFGYKKWMLLPPRYAELSGMPVADFYNDANDRKIRKYECTQRAGDVLLLPRLYGHATINPYGFAIGVGNLYIDAHAESTLVGHNDKNHNNPAVLKGDHWMSKAFREKPMRGYAHRDGRIRGEATHPSTMRALGIHHQHQISSDDVSAFLKDVRSQRPEVAAAFETLAQSKDEPLLELIRRRKFGKRAKSLKTMDLSRFMNDKVDLGIPSREKRTATGLAREPVMSTALSTVPAKRCERKISFVHVNKAGGTAMLENLRKCCSDRLLQTYARPLIRSAKLPRNFFFHGSGYRQKMLVGEVAWKDSYRFALVRNPWDRQVSMFHFLVGGQCGKEKQKTRCKERFLPSYGPWLEEPAEAIPKFREWMHQLDENFPVGHPKNYLFGSMAHGNDENSWYNASQLSWMVDGVGELMVEKVVKLEELSTEWENLMHNMCTDKIPLSHANPSKHTHYSAYYDAAAQDVVARHMAADIKQFGYRFEKA